MRIGLYLAYWPWFSPEESVELARLADAEGLDSVWVAEAWGQDTVSVLGHLSAVTERIGLGSGIMQIPARTPAMTAMAAATLDTLSGQRFRLGLGVSGPQVSEGWHGVRFGKPLARTREYVDVVKLALSRKTVQYEGEHFTLPLPDGPGKALKLMLHPYRERIPIYLAVIGPKNLELAGEIADGWLGIFVAPEHAADSLDRLRTGAERAGKSLADLDVVANVPVVIGDDLDACAEPLRVYTALYVGGMGSRRQNFYNALARRMGYEDAAERIQTAYLGKRHREAMAAVPRDLIDQTALIGPKKRIAERIHAYAEAGVTTLNITPFAADETGRVDTLRTVADVLAAEGLGDS
jgi:F420-dependent oxidoreductase-like protein